MTYAQAVETKRNLHLNYAKASKADRKRIQSEINALTKAMGSLPGAPPGLAG